MNLFQSDENLFTKLYCDTFKRKEGNVTRKLSRRLKSNMSLTDIELSFFTMLNIFTSVC